MKLKVFCAGKVSLLIGLLISLLFSVTVFAQSSASGPDFQTSNFPALRALELSAEEVTVSGAKDADGRESIISAWRAVQGEARKTLLPDGRSHPLVEGVRIKIASQLYAGGENAAALEEVQAGLAGIEDYVEAYPSYYADGIALMGVLFAQAGRADEAFPIVKVGLQTFQEIYETLPDEARASGLFMVKSNLEFSLSQIALRLSLAEDALDYQARSLKTREEYLGPNHPDTVASYYGYAGTLRRLGRMEEAERYARTAVSRAVEHVDFSHPSYARALEMLGIVLSRSGRPIEATDYLMRALDLKREYEGTNNLIFGYGIHNLATIFFQRQRFADAGPLFVEAESVFREKQGADSPFAIGSLAYAGQADFIEGRYEDAKRRLSLLQEKLGEDTDDLEIAMRITPDLSRTLLRDGQSDLAYSKADTVYQQLLRGEAGSAFNLRYMALIRARAAMAVDVSNVSQASAEAETMLAFLKRPGMLDARGQIQTERRGALDVVMEIATLTQDTPLMLSAIGLITGSDISQASLQRQTRLEEDEPELAELMRKLQEQDAQVDVADRALLQALVEGRDIEPAQSTLEAAEAERAFLLGLIRDNFPAWSDQVEHPDLSLSALKENLSSHDALLAVVPAYDGAYLLLLTREVQMVERAKMGRADMFQLARRLRESASVGDFDSDAALAFGEAVLPQHFREAMKNISHLQILTSGPLASLPFSLVQWNKDTFLIDRFALSNIPSLESQLHKVDDHHSGSQSFVGFANPATYALQRETVGAELQTDQNIASFFGRNEPNYAAIAALPPLPQTESEARAISTLFPETQSSLLIGDEATESAITQSFISDADVLLFATHGLVAGEVEGIAEPALILAPSDEEDGLLTTSEIERLTLTADWVILSACDSAAGMKGGLPAFSGFAKAFSFAGAEALLVTHWQVRDDAAAYVSVAAIKHYRAHGDKSAALRHAVLSLRNESGLRDANNPSIWGPFALIEG